MLTGALAGAGLVGLAGYGGYRLLDGEAPGGSSSSSTTSGAPAARASWMSGAAGEGVDDGSYAQARGSDVAISATWFDTNAAQVQLYTLQEGEEFSGWTKPLDISVGAIDTQQGESWAKAAKGAYDDRWHESLSSLAGLWGDREATAYLRFAHELNGSWYPWHVTAKNVDAFKTAWGRYRDLQQELFPDSKLLLCLNRESTGTSMDWRDMYPGDGKVDVMSVDYYNQYPAVGTASQWDASMTLTDQWGGPKGLQGHLDFAKSVGLPLAVSEWSGNAQKGDLPVFVQKMNDFFATHGGTGAGELLYEVQFNVVQSGVDDPTQFLLVSDQTRMPKSRKAYEALSWGS